MANKSTLRDLIIKVGSRAPFHARILGALDGREEDLRTEINLMPLEAVRRCRTLGVRRAGDPGQRWITASSRRRSRTKGSTWLPRCARPQRSSKGISYLLLA